MKIIQNFKETGLKRDGHGPLAPPLNQLLFAPSSPTPFDACYAGYFKISSV